jgi:hypothetical protein
MAACFCEARQIDKQASDKLALKGLSPLAAVKGSPYIRRTFVACVRNPGEGTEILVKGAAHERLIGSRRPAKRRDKTWQK